MFSELRAQDNSGIQFQHGITWAQIKAKAKEEHKYIFVDGFTTWCVPCKEMAVDIFPQKQVGDFFNSNFINVSVQFDKTKNDNAEVKNWYNDAAYLFKTYKVDSYPTFLFFDSDGNMVDKFSGGTKNADDFIAEAKTVFDPKLQYTTLKKRYMDGERDTTFLITLINTGELAKDDLFFPKVINRYLYTQTNLLTTKNIGLIVKATTKTTDPGFKILMSNSKKVDEIAGKGKSFEMTLNILFDNVALPYLRIGGTKINYGGGLMVYTGHITKKPNWTKVESVLKAKYGNYSQAELLFAKVNYYNWASDWPKYTQAVNSFIANYHDRLNNRSIDNFAGNILTSCDKKPYIDSAITWSQKTLSDNDNSEYIYTYADLLYKSGKKTEAINYLTDKINQPGDKYKSLNNLLSQIKMDKQTW